MALTKVSGEIIQDNVVIAGILTATNLKSQQISVTGISTVGSLSIGNTSVISAGRQLQNIASLDATTTATIESAITNAPNTFSDLSVTGVSTVGSLSIGATSVISSARQLQNIVSLDATTTATVESVVVNVALPKAGGIMTGDITLNAQSDLRFADTDSSNWVAFQAPATIAANVTWTLPATDASVSGYALKSNGSGQLSWGLAGGAVGTGTDQIFYENDQTITGNYSITAGKNAMTAGPVTVNSNITVTVPSGSFWSII